MNLTQAKTIVSISLICLCVVFLSNCSVKNNQHLPDHKELAGMYFQEDSSWYLDNIPFFQCSDKQLEQVYYYRWKMYKAHIRNVGTNEYVITEFIIHMPWDREPYCTINAASMHHIYEGRWLKDNRYMDGYIDYLLRGGGNNRNYSESISDAALARYKVNGDSLFLIKQLDSMKRMYNEWSDHFDSTKNLYYIAAMPDATEYTIASIDASGGKGGFEDGEAFRPTINSYMYANALAIAQVASMKGDASTSAEYLKRAAALKENVEKNLWNDSLQHFTDRFKVNNEFVHSWNFIRGRELAGFAPWYFNLPSDKKIYSNAWKHAIDTNDLLGQFGFRTNEPSYQYYFKQFAFFEGKPSSQWNGPSWPYQSSQALTAMANVLNNYHQDAISASDYVKLLRLYAQQHYLPDGKINLVENYDPNKGGPIVYCYWSNHYNHSTFNNLIITGLCGIRPSEGDSLVINPIVDSTIQYFYLGDVAYHGHKLTVIYDRDGSQYKFGKGLTVLVDGNKSALTDDNGKNNVFIGAPIVNHSPKEQPNYALNIRRKDFPKPSASINSTPDTALYQAIDGKIWYYPEVFNRWTTLGSNSPNDWYAVDFGQPHDISSAKIYLVVDNKTFFLPESVTIEYQQSGRWHPVSAKPVQLVGNTGNTILFDKVTATGIRFNFAHHGKQISVTEVQCY